MSQTKPVLVVRNDGETASLTLVYAEDKATHMHRVVRYDLGKTSITRREGLYPTPKNPDDFFAYSEYKGNEHQPAKPALWKEIGPLIAKENISDRYDYERISQDETTTVYRHAAKPVNFVELQKHYPDPKSPAAVRQPKVAPQTAAPAVATTPIAYTSGAFKTIPANAPLFVVSTKCILDIGNLQDNAMVFLLTTPLNEAQQAKINKLLEKETRAHHVPLGRITWSWRPDVGPPNEKGVRTGLMEMQMHFDLTDQNKAQYEAVHNALMYKFKHFPISELEVPNALPKSMKFKSWAYPKPNQR